MTPVSPPSTRFRRLLPAFVLGLVGALLPAGITTLTIVAAPSASATTTYLCTGYDGCNNAGSSDGGYGERNNLMYWRMYSGHNCTNYIAYRLIQAGMSSERPWSGTGMAYNWGLANAKITDQTPAVGAVAWWNRGVVGAGSSGHVAYVEKVISPTEILVSMDSWNGTFHWARMTKSGRGWPSGFIHFRDKAVQPVLANKTSPKVNGTPAIGEELKAGFGQWRPSPAGYALQWSADGVPIKSATGRTFEPAAAQLGKTISVQVTARKSGTPSVSATSAATPPVAKGQLVGQEPPTITGDPVAGQQLTATAATWARDPNKLTYRWLADGKVVRRDISPTLTLTPSMVGTRISVVEVGRRAGFDRGEVGSEASAPVLRGVINDVEPFHPSGTAVRGRQLGITPGRLDPDDAALTFQWLRGGTVVAGATSGTYSLKAADVGGVMSLRMTARKPQYRSLVRNYVYGSPVMTTPRLRARANGKRRSVMVHVRVSALGVDAPSGVAKVRVAGVTVSRPVVNGVLDVLVEGVRPGERVVKVIYAGTSLILPARAMVPVTIRR